jgi:hypothetical protein
MYLSDKTCRQLAEWKCDVEGDPKYCYRTCGVSANHKNRFCTESLLVCKKTNANLERFAWCDDIPAYDLRDIITNGEMAKAFFGEEILKDSLNRLFWKYKEGYFGFGEYTDSGKIQAKAFELHSLKILICLQAGLQEEAEAYLLKHTIFNPANQKKT